MQEEDYLGPDGMGGRSVCFRGVLLVRVSVFDICRVNLLFVWQPAVGDRFFEM